MGRDGSVAPRLFEEFLESPFESELLLESMFEGLEERNFPRVNCNLINVVDADGAADIQASRLGKKDVIVATIAIVIIRHLTGVAPRIDEHEGIPLVMSLSRTLTGGQSGETC